jgi:hypothetical protein
MRNVGRGYTEPTPPVAPARDGLGVRESRLRFADRQAIELLFQSTAPYSCSHEPSGELNAIMDKLRGLFILNILLLIVCPAAKAERIRSSIPSTAARIGARAGSVAPTPIWVSASAAFAKTGELRPELFSRADQVILKQNQKQNSIRCKAFLAPRPSEEFVAKDSLDALVANSLSVVRARLVEREPGFYNGAPGTLFALRPAAFLKSYGRISFTAPLFLFVPEATIQTPNGLICARTFSDIPLPALGDEVVAFVTSDPIDAEQRILEDDTRKQLDESHEGRVFQPAATEVSSAGVPSSYTNLDNLERAIRENKHIQDLPRRAQQ